jgi:hypothetical protein
MSLDISVGFNARPEAGYTGFEDGGIRISIAGTVLTRYEDYRSGYASYDANGESLDAPEEYVGEHLDFIFKHLKETITRFQDVLSNGTRRCRRK